MSITILKDVLIAKGKLDSYFDGQVPTNLWRALNKKSNQAVFDFIEQPMILSNGRPRGLSTFDKAGIPEGKDWVYYKIPKGTVLPEGIAIVKDEYNTRFGAHHYTIAPAYDMPLSQFKSKLALLATQLMREAM